VHAWRSFRSSRPAQNAELATHLQRNTTDAARNSLYDAMTLLLGSFRALASLKSWGQAGPPAPPGGGGRLCRIFSPPAGRKPRARDKICRHQTDQKSTSFFNPSTPPGGKFFPYVELKGGKIVGKRADPLLCSTRQNG